MIYCDAAGAAPPQRIRHRESGDPSCRRTQSIGPAASRDIAWSDLAGWAVGLSFADVARVTNDVLKDALVGQRERIQEEEIRAVINELKRLRGRLPERGEPLLMRQGPQE